MKSRKILIPLFSLTMLLLLTSVGFNIYQYHQIRGLLERIVQINPSDDSASITYKTGDKKDNKGNVLKKTEEKPITNKINELEYHLGAAEEADMANEQLSEELTKKEEYRKAMKSLALSITESDEAFTRRMLGNYDSLFKKLKISKEDLEKFKDLMIERDRATTLASPLNYTSEEKRNEFFKKAAEVSISYENKFRELLGEEQYNIYQTYSLRFSEHAHWDEFAKTLPPDNRLSEEQEDALIDSMYKGRQGIYSENLQDITSTSNNQKEIMQRSLKMTKLTNEKYLEAARGILSPEQLEQYKAYLLNRIEMMESSVKISSFLDSE